MAATASAPPALSPGDTALDHDDSNISSPLSEVDDEKDAGPDDVEDMEVENNEAHEDASDSDSNLSEANDTEAETERLYDTPPNPRQKDVVIDKFNNGQVFEHTPSKLQETVAADHEEAEHADQDSLSDDDLSMVSSHGLDDESPSKPTKSTEQSSVEDVKQISERRKRKRSLLPDPSDADQPLRKRTGSVGVVDGEHTEDDAVMADEDPLSTNTHSGEHSVIGDGGGAELDKDNLSHEEDAASTEPLIATTQTRSGSKRKTEASDNGDSNSNDINNNDEADAELQEDVRDGATEEEAEPHGDDDGMEADAEEDPEAAAKNDEEMEKKRLALEDWTDIEEKFGLFRERLYRDRLEKLEQEEQTLLADHPTHAEYLNMKQCLDDRLNARLRQIEKEHELEVMAHERLAVARRAEIWDNFYQKVRDKREKALEALNAEWFDIQNRRRSAHSVQDYGLLFPATHAQRTRNAVAYNNEVSILSGIAKHRGFPAVPPMRGASAQEIESDLEAIKRGRRPRQPSLMQPLEDHTLLGPAGEQFIKNTPWANPNHALHKLHQSSLAQPDGRSGSPMVGGKASQQALSGISNGRHSPPVGYRASASPELSKSAGTYSGPKAKRVGSLSSGGAGKATKTLQGDPPTAKHDSALAMAG